MVGTILFWDFVFLQYPSKNIFYIKDNSKSS